MSEYIIAMATSARVAQVTLSSGSDPMTVRRFGFEVDLSADFDVNSETEATMKVWRLDIKEKVTIDYKNHWGLKINCLIEPNVLIQS